MEHTSTTGTSAVIVNHSSDQFVTTTLPTWTREQIELIKRTVAKGATDDELALFMHICRRTGLDPMARQIYAIKRGGQMVIQTGIDGYRLTAARTGEHAGTDDAVFDSEDGQQPNKATTTVYRFVKGQRVPYTASARWSEYCQGSPTWDRMPYGMLAKCSEALALRKAFPAELSGLYTHEEIMQADNPEATLRTLPKPEEKETATDTISEGHRKRLFALAYKQKIGNTDLHRFLAEAYQLTSVNDISLDRYDVICQAIEDGSAAEFLKATPQKESTT